ncbi:MAG: cobalamin-dependent protein [Candidatus Riflebacteria bacterium]|nr:cobalamin-dependent protein [Candidatus Riflebacteria bacterium]
MSSGLYSTKAKDFNQKLDLTKLKPYGDTMNDGKTQVSFTLPVPDDDRSLEAARQLASKMGLDDVQVCFHQALDKNFTFYIAYGKLTHTIDITSIKVSTIESEVLDMHAVDEFIKEKIGRKLIVIGASTGTDAHTVGIDAIMNMKGYAGHYGLERYSMIDAFNLGSQVPNEDFIKKAVELKADVLLVSQTVTQKDIHITNMVELVEQLEAANLRDKVILIAGGPRITNDLAKELGYDAGFGPGKYSEDVASFFIDEFVKRKMK